MRRYIAANSAPQRQGTQTQPVLVHLVLSNTPPLATHPENNGPKWPKKAFKMHEAPQPGPKSVMEVGWGHPPPTQIAASVFRSCCTACAPRTHSPLCTHSPPRIPSPRCPACKARSSEARIVFLWQCAGTHQQHMKQSRASSAAIKETIRTPPPMRNDQQYFECCVCPRPPTLTPIHMLLDSGPL